MTELKDLKENHKMIIHKKIYRYDPMYLGFFYYCNWAVKPITRKYSYYWKDVTCKNCLKRKSKNHSHEVNSNG